MVAAAPSAAPGAAPSGPSAPHGTGAVVVAVLVNLAIAGATVAAFVVTGGWSLLAVGVLTSAAAVDQALLLLGGRRARRQAGDLHPTGAGRERYFWSFATALALFLLGAVAAAFQGIRLVDAPEALADPEWAYGALGAGCLLQLIALRVAVSQANGVRGRATWRQFLRHARSPELPVSLVEHVATLLALLLALGAVGAAEATGEAMWDGVGTIAIGALAGLLVLVLMVEMRSLLLGGTAGRKDVETIRAAVEVDPAVRELVHMRTQRQGPDELLVGMKVELDHELTFPEVSEVVNRLERNVRRAVPMARTLFIEPDVTDARRAAPTIDEHVPVHAVPEPIRARQRRTEERGALGVGIPVEDDL